MKVFITTLFFLMSLAMYSQSIYFGVRDNQYAHLGYIDKHRWFVIAEHSLFSTRFEQQSGRGYAGYANNYKNFQYKGLCYGTMQYDNTYKSYGGILEVSYAPTQWLILTGGIRPHYDTFYNYTTCYTAQLDAHIYKEIGLFTTFTNYPEFRDCEQRVKAGLYFRVKNLWIKPTISIPFKDRIGTTRILISFGYTLNLSKL